MSSRWPRERRTLWLHPPPCALMCVRIRECAFECERVRSLQATGDPAYADEMLERCLYGLEMAWHPAFNPPLGSCRVPYKHAANRPLFVALFRHMQARARAALRRLAGRQTLTSACRPHSSPSLVGMRSVWDAPWPPSQKRDERKWTDRQTGRPRATPPQLLTRLVPRASQNLSRRGLHATALEVCKLLLSLDPEDPLGGLQYVDYLSLRAGRADFLARLVEQWAGDGSLALLPGFAFSLALAAFRLRQGGRCCCRCRCQAAPAPTALRCAATWGVRRLVHGLLAMRGKRMGCSSSCSDCRIGHLVPISRP
jgi:Transcriptional repressor TCF25